MTIRRTTRRGKPVLVLDIHWQRKDGSQGRYRRDAQVQAMAAARAEERRILANIAQYGEAHEPKPELPEGRSPRSPPPPSGRRSSCSGLARPSPG